MNSKLIRTRLPCAAAAIGLAAMIFLFHLGVAQATYLDCPSIALGNGDQVVIGDLGVTPGTDPTAARIAQTRLKNAIWQRLSDLAASDGEGRDIHVTQCPPGHQPEKAEFREPIVSSIFASGVLLEVWALASAQDAQIAYILVPLLPPIGSGQTPDGFYEITYSIGPLAGLDKVFDDSPELRAFTMLGAGLRALGEAKVTSPPDKDLHGKAYKVLCRAYDLLAKAEQHPGGQGIPGTEWKALKSLALFSANTAAVNAQKLQGVTLENCAVPAPVPIDEMPSP
jgi:hypothetical protein